MTENKYLNPKILRVEPYAPNLGTYRIRLDANESPYAFPAELADEFASIARNAALNRYPDPAAETLVSLFAARYGISAGNVVAGNGSDELISLLCNSFLEKGDKVLTLTPDFSMYGFYAANADAQVLSYAKRERFFIDFDEVLSMIRREGIRLVIFSNPCNPTGISCGKDEILNFVRQAGCLVVVDEAYMEFCGKDASVLTSAPEAENLIVLKTLSKAFSSAALRIGFAVSNAAFTEALFKMKSPYNVNSLSQAFACAVLRNPTVTEKNIAAIRSSTRQLERFFDEHRQAGGYTLHPTDANFVTLDYGEGAKAKAVFSALAARGIVVRCFDNGFLRITSGTPEENSQLMEVFFA